MKLFLHGYLLEGLMARCLVSEEGRDILDDNLRALVLRLRGRLLLLRCRCRHDRPAMRDDERVRPLDDVGREEGRVDGGPALLLHRDGYDLRNSHKCSGCRMM